MAEGKTEKALEIFLLLRHCSIEYITIREDFDHLHADLQAVLQEGLLEAVLKQEDSVITPDQAKACLLAYALELVTE